MLLYSAAVLFGSFRASEVLTFVVAAARHSNLLPMVRPPDRIIAKRTSKVPNT
jgi:hypothetical protein